MSSSWEQSGSTWANIVASGGPPAGGGDPDDDAPFDWDTMTPAEAGQEFCDCLIDMKFRGKLSATSACTLSFVASRAGLVNSTVQKLAMKPGLASGSYSRHFDVVVDCGVKNQCLYDLPLSLKLKYDHGRFWETMPILPVHELLAEEYARHSAELSARLVENRSERMTFRRICWSKCETRV